MMMMMMMVVVVMMMMMTFFDVRDVNFAGDANDIGNLDDENYAFDVYR